MITSHVKSLPLDFVRNKVAATFSVYKKNSRYKSNKCFRIRRSDDDTEIDIGFSGIHLDVPSIHNFLKRNIATSPLMNVDTDSDGVVDDFASYTSGDVTATWSLDSAQKFDITASTGTGLSYIYQAETITAGQIVNIEVDYKVLGNVTIKAYIDWYNVGAFISTSTIVDGIETTYTRLSNSGLTAPTNTTVGYIRLSVEPNSNGDTGSAWFKNLNIYKTNLSAFVKTWYDQSGNGNDATMTTNASQPRIVNAGTLEVDSKGKPRIYFDGSNDILTIANSASVDITAQPLFLNCVFAGTGTIGYMFAKNLDSSATLQYAILYNNGGKKCVTTYLQGTTIRQETAINSIDYNTQAIFSLSFANGAQKGYVNGASSGNDGNYNSTMTSRANMNIGGRSGSVDGSTKIELYQGYISEIIIISNTTNRNKIEKKQSKYYEIQI